MAKLPYKAGYAILILVVAAFILKGFYKVDETK